MRWVCLTLVFCGFGFAMAQSGPVDLLLKRYLITEQVDEGEINELVFEAVELRPGDMIEERLIASNIGDEDLGELVLELPIPSGSIYLAESAKILDIAGAAIAPQFSFDSGLTYAYPPLIKEVKVVENGEEVIKKVEVLASDYTHVRWLIPGLRVNEQIDMSFRAHIR